MYLHRLACAAETPCASGWTAAILLPLSNPYVVSIAVVRSVVAALVRIACYDWKKESSKKKGWGSREGRKKGRRRRKEEEEIKGRRGPAGGGFFFFRIGNRKINYYMVSKCGSHRLCEVCIGSVFWEYMDILRNPRRLWIALDFLKVQSCLNVCTNSISGFRTLVFHRVNSFCREPAEDSCWTCA